MQKLVWHDSSAECIQNPEQKYIKILRIIAIFLLSKFTTNHVVSGQKSLATTTAMMRFNQGYQQSDNDCVIKYARPALTIG